MQPMLAFIDESGNTDLEVEKSGVTKYFVLTAIVITEDSVNALAEKTENMRKLHFQTGEMKSSSIKNKDSHSRRIKIISDILNLDFKFYSLAFSKADLKRDGGLQHKSSFFKFINNQLYKQLFRTNSEIKIFADEHGNNEFIQSFKRYIENNKPDLFWKSQVEIVDSKSNVLIQLADFVAGTIAQIYENKSNPALNEACRKLIREKSISTIEWPTKYQTYFYPTPTSKEFDTFICNHSLTQAEIFIAENEKSSDSDVILQIAVLRYLVFISRFDESKDYIATQEILRHLTSIGFLDVTEQAIRSTIIAKLRDNGVLISSCNKGYKIPMCYGDLIDFVMRVNGLVMPLLERLKKARTSYLQASNGTVDLLRGTNYVDLVAFLNQLDHSLLADMKQND